MLSIFQTHMGSKFPELFEKRFLLACSGGLDSVVLTHLCHESQLDFALAHCNFGLRGEESDLDEKFVSELAEKIKKPFFLTHLDTLGYVNKHKVSVQMAARELRYAWFKKILKENNIPILVTAHHADDDLETFLINLSRGTGIDGLVGIPSKTDFLCRPLLPFSREQILEYAKSNNLEWREDKSNNDTKYLRNKIRLEIIPALKELHPTFLDNYKNTQSFLRQTSKIADHRLQEIKKKLFVKESNFTRIAIDKLKELEPLSAYLYGLLNEFGFTEWDNIADLLDAMSGKYVLSDTHKLLKDRSFLLLSERQFDDSTQQHFSININQEIVAEPLEMKFTVVDNWDNNTDAIIYVAKKALKYPLVIRKWKNGDYFYPLGLQGKKKLSKFFKDEKIDVFSKKDQWLLCSGEDIVWVIGRRADERFKVKEDTKEILRIEATL